MYKQYILYIYIEIVFFKKKKYKDTVTEAHPVFSLVFFDLSEICFEFCTMSNWKNVFVKIHLIQSINVFLINWWLSMHWSIIWNLLYEFLCALYCECHAMIHTVVHVEFFSANVRLNRSWSRWMHSKHAMFVVWRLQSFYLFFLHKLTKMAANCVSFSYFLPFSIALFLISSLFLFLTLSEWIFETFGH